MKSRSVWLASALLASLFFSGAAQAAQKTIGTACNSDNSNIDWDTIGQCNGTVFQKGPLILGAMTNPPYSATTCTSSNAGMLQWTGTSFQGCTGSAWTNLAGGGSSILGTSATANSPYATGDINTGLFSGTATTVSIATAGVERLRVTATGSVGIGTSEPIAPLEIQTPNYGSSMITVLSLRNPAWNIRQGLDIDFYQGSAGGNYLNTARISSQLVDSTNGNLFFDTTNNGVGDTRMMILNNGNVGIATATPTQALDVNGNINISSLANSLMISGTPVLRQPASDTTSIAVGPYALASQTATGTGNTALGWWALNQNTTGDGNTAVGGRALFLNTTGVSNTAVGSAALYVNNGGSNTAVGYQALAANTSGSHNTANGWAALNQNTTGEHNAAYGSWAQYWNTTGSYNTALGYGAAYQTDGVDRLVAVGADALGDANATTATGNTAVGYNGLGSVTSGGSNTALGYNAGGTTLTTGSNNILIGVHVDTALAGTSNAIAIGGKAGEGDTAVGIGALAATATDNLLNTAVGSSALTNLTTGSHNTAVGASAMYWNSTGIYNVAIGHTAMAGSTTGSGNVAIGNYALTGIYNGAPFNNTAVGGGALYSSGGEYNTAVGNGALSLTTTGHNNTALGYSVGSTTLTTGSNNILIGTTASVDTPDAGTSNFLNIGNVINADMANGRIGINLGTTIPTSNPLTVGNSTSNGDGAFLSPAGTWTNMSDRRMKENVRPVPYGLEALMKLKPVAYEMVGTHEKQIGFIAQEVEPVVPEVVSANSAGRYGLSYGNLLAVAVKAIQEQEKAIEKQEKEITTLKEEIAMLKARSQKK